MFENIFETVNSGFAQAIYEDFLRDPGSVPAEWRQFFEGGIKGETPVDPPASKDGPSEPAGTTVAASGPEKIASASRW